MIIYRTARSAQDMEQIIELQRLNLAATVGEEEARAQGFVTLVHDVALLTDMNREYGHSVAIDAGQLVGYALMMPRSFGSRIPALTAMLDQLAILPWQGRRLSTMRYFIMGQVCVAKSHRGRGVFAGLYQHLCSRLAADFEVVVTEIASHNTRSCRAHAKLGFIEIHRYLAKEDTEWIIVGKKCRE
ncbi:MAG: GNAT family N-acetyltransferase [Bacteroidetes bacterium]|nr:MAG: GNAT family N-acetyltransferase [Bacteroidota bacterium]